jgi:hypothetical protein
MGRDDGALAAFHFFPDPVRIRVIIIRLSMDGTEKDPCPPTKEEQEDRLWTHTSEKFIGKLPSKNGKKAFSGAEG